MIVLVVNGRDKQLKSTFPDADKNKNFVIMATINMLDLDRLVEVVGLTYFTLVS